MRTSRLAVARSVAITSFALVIGPVAVLLAARTRGRWMWDYTNGGLPIWQPEHWLLDPRIAGAFAFGVLLITVVELHGPRPAPFRLAVRLAPAAFSVPVVAVLAGDPELVDDGQACFDVAGASIDAEAGDMIIVPTDAVHGFTNTGTTMLRITAIHENERAVTLFLDGTRRD